MKKILACLFAICSFFAFAACGGEKDTHTHDFNVSWSKDDEKHWKECVGENCVEQAEKSSHQWNDGMITLIPTKETPGIRTFTCEQCGHMREETVIYQANNEVSQAGWINSFNAQELNNVTLIGKIISPRTGDVPICIRVQGDYSYERMEFSETNISESYYEKEGDSYRQYRKRISQSVWVDELQEFCYNGETFLAFMPLTERYVDFTYNTETRCYEAGEMDCQSALLGTLKYESVVLQFEDGKVVSIKAKMREAFSVNLTSEPIIEYEFSFVDYGNTVVDLSIVKGQN